VTFRTLVLLGASAAVLSACAVGPTYRAPGTPAGVGDRFVALEPGVASSEEPAPGWWRLFDEPALDALTEQALVANRDIAVAAANLARVRAVLGETRSQRLPSTGLSAGASVTRQPGTTGEYESGESFTAGLDVSYEVDFFGRVRRSIEASRADVDAAREAVEVVRISVAGETARAWADACAANAQLAVARRTIELQENSLALVQRQLDAGRGTGLDTARAGAELESTRASLPPLEAQRDAALFRLAVLTGQPPAQLSTEARSCARIPQVKSVIPVGDGQALLRRRPDVRQAERNLAAATARIGVATAALYPSVTLGGSFATGGADASDFGSDISFKVGPLITWNFPNLAAARARVAQADAAAQGALAQFEATSLAALQETETALVQYARELDRRTALRRARDESARAVRLSRMRFEAGRENFLTVLDAERTLAGLEAQLVQSDATVTTYQINLFKALAGGW